MEEKEVNLEDLGSKLKNLEREKLKLVRDLEQWNGEQSKLDTFERENRDLMQVCAYTYFCKQWGLTRYELAFLFYTRTISTTYLVTQQVAGYIPTYIIYYLGIRQ